jgi:hypothetical protein
MNVGLLKHGLRVRASSRLKNTCKVSTLSVLVVDLQTASVVLLLSHWHCKWRWQQGSRRSLCSKMTSVFVFRLNWQTGEVAECTSAKNDRLTSDVSPSLRQLMGNASYVPRAFPHRRILDRRSFSAFNARFERNGTFYVQTNGRGRPQRVVTSQGEVTVLDVISGNPDTSKRRVATREGVLQNTVSWESCTLSFSTKLEGLLPSDYQSKRVL